MKTIEIAVRLTAQVRDEIAEQINGDNETFSVELPLEQLQLQRYNLSIPAKFVEYETMNVEQLSD